MNLGDLNKVWEVKALKKKPRADEATKILEKVANQVQPIMTRRKWRVKLFSEFCPTNARLLGVNVNRGVQVKLRLRRVNHDGDFLSYHEVLDTMLHELCHNAHGPHNASFYKLWDELRKECEELMSKGITGTGKGFDVPGKRLGGFSRQPPLSSLRVTAASAAEKRVRAGTLLPSGPHRLGGDSNVMSDLSPIQAAAMAAERRLLDDIWCGSQSTEGLEDEENDSETCKEPISERVDCTSSNAKSVKRCSSWSNASFGPQCGLDVIDLTEEAPVTRCTKRSCSSSDQGPSFSKDEPNFGFMNSSVTFPSTSHDANHNREEPSMWECAECTLLNRSLALICELCTALKPKEREMKHKVWSCKFCTLENEVKLEKCEACGQWRYSYGAPLSTGAPNVGT
ncbi:PREDICTED: DNA-dependent metalloprotease WSS1-like [Camelina sativa]|uniref:DNA-dependent metalloprotease WSS1-like n=1 Tax=Camelina sativa TaxID=90675 RepID=A0ABM0VXC5_CAMSA|nr:PREDICTED: DNA-dependent metalloprotease WSS1-like [Camelina sativa]XP_010462457.1 PREDICTED: DNA-dependent metalloprotease WSS1-like [Camelina sativa]